MKRYSYGLGSPVRVPLYSTSSSSSPSPPGSHKLLLLGVTMPLAEVPLLPVLEGLISPVILNSIFDVLRLCKYVGTYMILY